MKNYANIDEDTGEIKEDDVVAVFGINGRTIIAYTSLDLWGDGYIRYPCVFRGYNTFKEWPFFINPDARKKIPIKRGDYSFKFVSSIDPVLIENYEQWIKEHKYEHEQSD